MAQKSNARSDRVIAASLTLRHARDCQAGERPVTNRDRECDPADHAAKLAGLRHDAEQTGVDGLKVSVD